MPDAPDAPRPWPSATVTLYPWLGAEPSDEVWTPAFESLGDTPYPVVTVKDDDGKERIVAIVLDTGNFPNGDNIAAAVAATIERGMNDV